MCSAPASHADRVGGGSPGGWRKAGKKWAALTTPHTRPLHRRGAQLASITATGMHEFLSVSVRRVFGYPSSRVVNWKGSELNELQCKLHKPDAALWLAIVCCQITTTANATMLGKENGYHKSQPQIYCFMCRRTLSHLVNTSPSNSRLWTRLGPASISVQLPSAFQIPALV